MANKSVEINVYTTYMQLNLMNDTRNNVFQLVMWSRSLINVIASELKSVEAVIRKISTLPIIFNSSFKPYMGDEAAQEFQNLLFQHIIIFTKIIAYFGDIRTLISETSGQHIGIIRTAYRKHPDTLPG